MPNAVYTVPANTLTYDGTETLKNNRGQELKFLPPNLITILDPCA